jgi:alkanesulfonate monooxygenase SsuD/methylene tetrahydromethanopterin reductase-like flavin-dependent oxidoreductase (luciferase family)
LLVPDLDALFGASLGQWNGADAAEAAGRAGCVRADRVPARPDRTHHRHGDTFDGEFYQVSDLDPAAAPAPRVFTGSVGPKSLAVTGQLADGWIPPGGSDWLSQLYRESRPRVDATRGEDGRWIGGSVK